MTFDPIQIRDLLIADEGEPDGFTRESAIRQLVRRGWPIAAILAEIPGVSESEIYRALDAEQRAA